MGVAISLRASFALTQLNKISAECGNDQTAPRNESFSEKAVGDDDTSGSEGRVEGSANNTFAVMGDSICDIQTGREWGGVGVLDPKFSDKQYCGLRGEEGIKKVKKIVDVIYGGRPPCITVHIWKTRDE